MLPDIFFEKLKEQAESFCEEGGSHEFSHTERVYNLALKIAKEENADVDVIKAAALLHDIARSKEDNKECKCHAEEGAKMAEKILKELNFPEEKISKVVYAIKIHRHSTNITPETKEAAIIQDADRLDALGAITIARMFSSGGKVGIPLFNPQQKNTVNTYKGQKSTIDGFHKKILKITPDTFKTKRAQEIAIGRYKFVEDFLARFIDEWNGKQ